MPSVNSKRSINSLLYLQLLISIIILTLEYFSFLFFTEYQSNGIYSFFHSSRPHYYYYYHYYYSFTHYYTYYHTEVEEDNSLTK